MDLQKFFLISLLLFQIIILRVIYFNNTNNNLSKNNLITMNSGTFQDNQNNLPMLKIINIKENKLQLSSVSVSDPIVIIITVISSLVLVAFGFFSYYYMIPWCRRKCRKRSQMIKIPEEISLMETEGISTTLLEDRITYTNLNCIVNNYNKDNNYITNRNYVFKERSFIKIENQNDSSGKDNSKSDEKSSNSESYYYIARNHTIAISSNTPKILNNSNITSNQNIPLGSKSLKMVYNINENIKADNNCSIKFNSDDASYLKNITELKDSYVMDNKSFEDYLNNSKEEEINKDEEIYTNKHISFNEL